VAGPVEDDAVALSWYSKAADQVNLSAADRF
jgi:TPR repeat protein